MLDNDVWRHLTVTIPLEDREALKRKKGGPAPGTCQWILRTEELTTWLGSGQTVGLESQLAQVLCFYGNPGTGKSTMAIYLTEELSKHFSSTNRKTLAYFFCDSAVATRNNALSIVTGLLYQLVDQHNKLLGYLLPKYRERGAKLFTSFDALWEIFMTMVADENTGHKYCIIDALDECEPESREDLSKQLEETFQSPDCSSNFRIIVTSRPYPEIRDSLQMFPNRDLASFAQREKDVELFIEQKVNELTKKKKYTDKVKLEVCRILQDKAEGTFLWIGLACDELKDILSCRVIRTLQNIPKGLNSLYNMLLETALKPDETSGDDVRLLLSCVAVSLRPLTVLEHWPRTFAK
jgi:DNA polymerase III delta prime subunit